MINNKYQVTDIIKQAPTKTVYRVNLSSDSKKMAIVKAYHKTDERFFHKELEVYNLIKEPHLNGFAEIKQAFQWEANSCLVFSELGDNVQYLRRRCGGRLTLKTVLLVALQILDRIEYVHKLGYLHGDIKPMNFLIGSGKAKHRLFLVDFQLSSPYTVKGQHIKPDKIDSFSGSIRFCSLEANKHNKISRKDEIQSFIYSLIFLLKGDLPWTNLKSQTLMEAYDQTGNLKKENRGLLFEGLPDSFGEILRRNDKLKFNEQPEYEFVRHCFKSLMKKNGYEIDYKYDWEYL